MPSTNAFHQLVEHPVKFRLYLLMKLPSAFFAGVRVVSLTDESCVVKVPFKWFSQNPFKSTYFACLAMAAEMSTGILAMAHTYQRKPSVSMLVVELNAVFHKKATAATFFTCNQGKELHRTIEKALNSGEPQTVQLNATGNDKNGAAIATFSITWSFKTKKT